MKRKFCKLGIVALANDGGVTDPYIYARREGANWEFALPNDAGVDDDGWALIAPFGEWPKTRLYRDGNEIKEQHFIQVLDNESADSMLAVENSFFRKMKRALVGIPVYKMHGDLKDLDPKSAAHVPEKIKLGVVDQIRKGARGIEAHFALDNEGARAVEEGCKFPSALWMVQPIEKRSLSDGTQAIVARPFKLASVALTPFPNISGVESLANSQTIFGGETPAEKQQQKGNEMKQIAGWLRARGVTLANAADPNELNIIDGLETLFTSRAGEITALGNEKSTLTTTVQTLTSERDSHKSRADQNATALANEQTARKADRKVSAAAVADAAIKLGIKTVAERDSTIAALENSADFVKDSQSLLATAPTHKTAASGLDMSGRQQAALSNEQQALANEYDTAFKAEIMVDQNPTAAHNRIMTLPKYKGIAEKLVPKAA